MNVKIVGIKDINYTNKSGRQIIGTELHVTYKTEKVIGETVEKFYVPNSVNDCKCAKVGQNVNILFNQFGKVDFLQFAS